MKSYCNNCSKLGHSSTNCKMPITSIGIIVFRFRPVNSIDNCVNNTLQQSNKLTPVIPEFLLICRKNTLGYIEFLCGKYSVYNKNYILNMMKQMTQSEKHKLRTLTFNALWKDLWGKEVDLTDQSSIRNEEQIIKDRKTAITEGCVSIKRNEDAYVCERFHLLIEGIYSKNVFYTINTLLDESDTNTPVINSIMHQDIWNEPEWGFPKGRKNYQEKELNCAFREFEEETGYSSKTIKLIENISPFEEIFTGSNYKSYKHKYYLAFMEHYDNNLPIYENGEVSKMGWFTFEECLEKIRYYNIEKKNLITNVNNIIKKYNIQVS